MLGNDIFSETFDYVALGHFHIASKIGGNENIRYCGSPIPMGFGEAKQQKKVVLVDCRNEGIAGEIAGQARNDGQNIPIIATGHLSVTGGQRSGDDGVRDTYIGTIEMLGSDIFPETFDYVALGHYHIASKIGGNEKIRYCGSPIPMGFGEAKQQKRVVLVDCRNGGIAGQARNDVSVTEILIPCFQKLESIHGDKDFISNRLEELKQSDKSVWVEIIYDGDEVFPDLTTWANEKIVDTKIEILNYQNKQYVREVLTKNDSTQSLDELDKFEVFDKLLEKSTVSEEQKKELKDSYNEIVLELNIEN
jgi:exonuclease SbcD